VSLPELGPGRQALRRRGRHRQARLSQGRLPCRKRIPCQCNAGLDPAVADVVESFCAVELYLPDYVRNAMSVWRPSRAWFYANWGYDQGDCTMSPKKNHYCRLAPSTWRR